MVLPGVDPGVRCPDAGVDVAGMVIKPHVLYLLGSGGASLMGNKLSLKLDILKTIFITVTCSRSLTVYVPWVQQ